MESISKSKIQGVWDPAHSIRTGIIAHSTPVEITSGYRHYTRLPPLHPTAATFHPDVHIRKSAAAAITSGCLTFGIQEPDGRGGRFNFSGYTYPDPLIALTWRVSQPILHSAAGFLLKLPNICHRHFEIFCFRYLMSVFS